jgi:hypothetical protein
MPAVPTGPRLPSRYPVAPMGYPSGASYPNAQDAAQGWAGEMGFNINPRGGLLLRPWEAQSWQLSGIDPSLWDAPFARSGFLGGGATGGVPGGVPGTTGTTGGFGTTGTAGTTTDTSGNQWVMTPGGQWVPAGSDYATALAAGNAMGPNFYDTGGAWVGAEGGGPREAYNRDLFNAPQSPLGAAFMGMLANNPVRRAQDAINIQLGKQFGLGSVGNVDVLGGFGPEGTAGSSSDQAVEIEDMGFYE